MIAHYKRAVIVARDAIARQLGITNMCYLRNHQILSKIDNRQLTIDN